MRRIIDFFRGMLKVRIDSVRPGKAISDMYSEGCEVYSPKPIDDVGLEFTVPRREKEKVRKIADKSGGEFTVIEEYGLPEIFGRYRYRYGIAVGIIIYAALIAVSSSFVWRVEIKGSESGSPDSYIETVKNAGLAVGSPVYWLDINEIQHRCVLSDERLAWVSLNRVGTVVTAEIKEAKNQDSEAEMPSNVVSGYDAQIESVEIHKGVGVVGIGETVKKGDLLISGVVEDASAGVKTLCADGEVMGRVTFPIRVEIGGSATVKVYSGREKNEKIIFFFGIPINLFIKYGNYSGKYDTMVSRKNIQLYDGTVLPIQIKEVCYREYETEDITLSDDETVARAVAELEKQTREILRDSSLLSREQKAYFTDGSFVIESELTVLKNIALKYPLG